MSNDLNQQAARALAIICDELGVGSRVSITRTEEEVIVQGRAPASGCQWSFPRDARSTAHDNAERIAFAMLVLAAAVGLLRRWDIPHIGLGRVVQQAFTDLLVWLRPGETLRVSKHGARIVDVHLERMVGDTVLGKTLAEDLRSIAAAKHGVGFLPCIEELIAEVRGEA